MGIRSTCLCAPSTTLTLSRSSFTCLSFVVWAFQIFNMRPEVIIHECTPEFDVSLLLEIFAAATAETVALAGAGAKATASGVYLDGGNPIHQLAFVNDGRYGNSRSWIAKNRTNTWVQIELGAPTLIHRIKWARDREGHYDDRLAAEYTFDIAPPRQLRLNLLNQLFTGDKHSF